MGLRAAFGNAAAAAFRAFGDIPETIVYYAGDTNPTYNPDTGLVTSSAIGESVEFIFTYFKRNEIDNLNVLVTDIKGMCLQADLSEMPRISDTIIRGTLIYQVKYFHQDSAAALWNFKLGLVGHVDTWQGDTATWQGELVTW